MSHHVPCPCCHSLTLWAFDFYDICPVCYWEDEPGCREDPDAMSQANGLSLADARRNFIAYGACDERSRARVRAPMVEEVPHV